MVQIKVTPTIGIQDIRTNRFIKHPVGCRLADVAQNIRSNNYNFEEEWLLGNDRIITRQYDNDNHCYREKIEFRTENVTNKYYYIDYYEYDLRPDALDFDTTIRDDHIIHFDLYNKDNSTFPQTTESDVEPVAVVQEYKLYQWNDGESEPISVREVKKTIVNENGIIKPKIIEKITHANQYENYYFIKDYFSRQFTPNNFVKPFNPIIYPLQNTDLCGFPLEEVDTVMNRDYVERFDDGISFYMKGTSGYMDAEGQYDPVDTLIFNNNKFVYTHSISSSYREDVSEYHYFILPVKDNFFKDFYDYYLEIHGKMVSKSGNNIYGQIKPVMLRRVNQNRVEEDYFYNETYIDNLNINEEFIVSDHLPSSEDDCTNFIGFCICVNTKSDPFTLEIDSLYKKRYDE